VILNFTERPVRYGKRGVSHFGGNHQWLTCHAISASAELLVTEITIFITAAVAAEAVIYGRHLSCAYHENTSIAVSVDAPELHHSSRLYQNNKDT